MKNQHLILLLQIIKNAGSIDSLLDIGYEYSQIANFIVNIKELGLIAEKDGILCLSDKGREKLEELNQKLKRENFEKWVSPEERSRIEKLKENDIYLPNIKKLNF